MKFKKLVESVGSENKMTIRVASGLNADGCDIVVTDAEGNILHKEEYRYGYNASHSKKWAEWYPEKPFMKDIIDGLCSKYGIDKSAITFKAGANVFSGTDVSDASVVEFRNNFVESLTETYWIDNKDVMTEVDRLGKELEADGFKYYSDKYSGSKYYNFFTKRGDNGAVCKAVQYNYDGAQIIDVTVNQVMGYEAIDSFDSMRRKLGKMLLPQNESVEDDKEEDQFVLYFPYLEPKIISKDRAIQQMEFELNEFKNNSGARIAGRGFGIYCLRSYDPDTNSVWTGRYGSKDFLKTLSESILNEDLEDDFDILLRASDLKCKLNRHDIEEAANFTDLIADMEKTYNNLAAEYGAENIKWWRFYEDDDVDFGYKVCLIDGSKKIVEINDGKIEEVNESITEAADEQRYVICGVTNEGTRMLYDAVNDNFTTDYASATKYTDMDVARADWFNIPRTGFRRIFIPIYDPAIFEEIDESSAVDKVQINEGTGADTRKLTSDALKLAAEGDKREWANTASNVVDLIPDSFADDLFDAVKEKFSDIRLNAEAKKKIAGSSDGNVTEEQLEDSDTLGKVLELFDSFEWAKKNPALLKSFIVVILGIVAIIEPTPVLELVTSIVLLVPADVVAKILAFLNTTTVVGMAGHIANQLHKKSKNEDYIEEDESCDSITEALYDADVSYIAKETSYEMAEQIARMAKRALGLPAHEVEILEHDINNLRSDEWVDAFGGLSDRSKVKQLFFTHAVQPDEDDFETDYRYYVYNDSDNVVSDAFDFDEDAIEWAKENNYPVVKIHNYYRDSDGQLNPDGDPEVIWEAE